MDRMTSFVWGIVASLLGGLVQLIVPLPFVGVLAALVLYWYRLRPRGASAPYFLLGYFSLGIVLTFYLIGAVIR